MHKSFMLAALEQAWLGRGLCSPNPAVGAVAVRNGKIIAQAFHAGAGSAHAEQKLLANCPENCADITLYVTLEPCNHWGRTPPCVDAIISKRVQQVVYGFKDPNPIVAANGTPQQLEAQGINVVYYPLTEIDAFYQSYVYWIKTKRPWVTVKMAQTLDGKIADEQSQPVQLSNQACFEFTHQQRLYSDVILTTARTVRQDNPALNVRKENQVIQSKPVAILDTEGCIQSNAQIFKTAKNCIIFHAEHHSLNLPDATAVPVPVSPQGLNIEKILDYLGALGFHDVWVEAGATLFNTLHQARLVQRTYLYLVPKVLGPQALNLYHHPMMNQPFEISWEIKEDNVIAKIDWR